MPLLAKSSPDVRRIQTIFYLNAMIWLIFAATVFLRLSTLHPEAMARVTSSTLLMFGNVVLLFVGGVLLGKRSRWRFSVALILLIVTAVFAVISSFGLFTIIVLITDAISLWFLIRLARWYWSQDADNQTVREA